MQTSFADMVASPGHDAMRVRIRNGHAVLAHVSTVQGAFVVKWLCSVAHEGSICSVHKPTASN